MQNSHSWNMWSVLTSWIWPATGRTYQGAKGTPNGNCLPPRVHLTLKREDFNNRGRLIIVGDIHEFSELLQKTEFKEAVDTLILVGDLVNKGPASAAVVRRARSLKAYAVRGNHDDSGMKSYEAWSNKGRKPKAKHAWVKSMSEADAEWMRNLPFTLAIPAYRSIVVHAGLVPGVPLGEQGLSDMYKMRDLVPKDKEFNPATMLETANFKASEKPANDLGQAWASCWPGPDHVFFGHDAMRKLQMEAHATGLDTGCCYGGELTACILPPLESLGTDNCSRAPENPAEHTKYSADQTATRLADIGGQIVQVSSNEVYEKPSGAAD